MLGHLLLSSACFALATEEADVFNDIGSNGRVLVEAQLWAGSLHFPPYGDNMPLNITVDDASVASFQWTYEENGAGVPCFPTVEKPNWVVQGRSVIAHGFGNSTAYYGFEGTLSGDGKDISGILLGGDQKAQLGTWQATLDAQRKPSTCVAPAPPAPSCPKCLVWPPPQDVKADGPPTSLASNFAIRATVTDVDANSSLANSLLAKATARFEAVAEVLAPAATRAVAGDAAVALLDVSVASADTRLSSNTAYDYELSIAPDGTAKATATSVYGAMYAMETFVQLIDLDGHLRSSTVSIRDAPQYKYRGLMLDIGRRFFPTDLVRNIMDTMAANKLNVMHLHLSDHCRWAVESKLFPNLTGSLTGDMAGHYTQQEVVDLVSYARDRGIRVIPEFDTPGHSRGLLALESEGLKFCSPSDPHRASLYNDPDGSTFAIMTALIKEMSALFDDEVFNIGCDEVGTPAPCTKESTADYERAVFDYLHDELGKTSAAWEESVSSSAAARQDTIIGTWNGLRAGNITSTGRRAVESHKGHFYLTLPGTCGYGPVALGEWLASTSTDPKWERCWYGIDSSVPASQMDLLEGGSISMWTDSYTNTYQCGAADKDPPAAGVLFGPDMDAEFGKSVAGMMWPRGFVAAGSFWNFNESVDPLSDDFVSSIWRLNDQLIARGSLSCPTRCPCDQLHACGKPYIDQAYIDQVVFV